MTEVQTLQPIRESATATTSLRKRSFDEASLSPDQPMLYTVNDQLQSIEAPAAFPTPESGPTTGGMSRQSSPALSTLSNTPSIPQLDGAAPITKPNVPKKRKIDELEAAKNTDQPHGAQATKGKPAKKKLSEEEEKARLEKQRLKEQEKARKQAAKEAREEKKRQAEEAKEEKRRQAEEKKAKAARVGLMFNDREVRANTRIGPTEA